MTQHSTAKPPVRNSDVYHSRFKACLDEAMAANLPNVRERALRAAAAWNDMYEKAQLFERRSGR